MPPRNLPRPGPTAPPGGQPVGAVVPRAHPRGRAALLPASRVLQLAGPVHVGRRADATPLLGRHEAQNYGPPRACCDGLAGCGAALSPAPHLHPTLPRFPASPAAQAVEHYRRTQPAQFAAADRQVQQDQGQVLRVAFMPRAKLRQIVNLEEVLPACRAWVPPDGTRFKRTDCILLPDGTPGNYVALMAQMQTVHVLVRALGAGCPLWLTRQLPAAHAAPALPPALSPGPAGQHARQRQHLLLLPACGRRPGGGHPLGAPPGCWHEGAAAGRCRCLAACW